MLSRDEVIGLDLALKSARDQIATRRRTRYRRSQLERVRAELVHLRRAGATWSELQIVCRTRFRITVDRTTVMRFLRSLPELANE